MWSENQAEWTNEERPEVSEKSVSVVSLPSSDTGVKDMTVVEEVTPKPFKFKKRTRKICHGEVCFKDQELVQDVPFYLQGIAKRTHLVFDVYMAAFYLSDQPLEKSHGVPLGAKLIILEYSRTIEKQKVIDSIIDNVDSNPDADAKNLRSRFDQFSDAFEPPHKGSRYYFVYVPEKGTSMIKDGHVTITIPGDDFAEAFFGLWFHEKVGNPELREKLLAGV